MTEEIVPQNSDLQNGIVVDENLITPDYYLGRYKEFLPRYISHANPTQDTLDTYADNIDIFLRWCRETLKRHPLGMHDYQMRIYIESLYHRNYAQSTVNTRLTAIRAFYHIAMMLGLIRENPCAHIHVGSFHQDDEQFKFFTPDQIAEILKETQQESNDFVRLRNTAIILLMANEGLRVVEIMRMNDEDIRWPTRSIYIRGKGHAGTIYPGDQTLDILKKYLTIRPKPKKEDGEMLTPTFLSDSNNHKYCRISRHGVRDIINPILQASGYKEKGFACHIFRHSCGTNLYAATKDLRTVQETLRQRDPKVTARYAHVQERMTKRDTNKIAPKIDLK